jgi:hypothetical protein
MKFLFFCLVLMFSLPASAKLDDCNFVLLPGYEKIQVREAHEVEGGGFVFDARAVKGQTQSTVDTIFGVHHERTETILDLMIGHLPKSTPDLASLLGIYRISENQSFYPNVTLLNRRLDRLDNTVWGSPVRFQEVRGDQEISPYVYAQLWESGFHPFAMTGFWHFHDLGVHGIGAILLPKAVVTASRQIARFWLQCTEHPILQLNPSFHAFALKQVDRISEDIDMGTARMNSGAHALHRPGHFGWSSQSLIAMGILMHVEFRTTTPILYIDAMQLLSASEIQIFSELYTSIVKDHITPAQLPELAAESLSRINFNDRFQLIEDFNKELGRVGLRALLPR